MNQTQNHVNAFTLCWKQFKLAYAFPPFVIVGKVLSKVRQDEIDCVVIVPNWPNQNWYSYLIRMLIDCPIILHTRDKILTSPLEPDVVLPLSPKLMLLACLISGNHSKNKNFQQKLLTSSSTNT